MNKFMNTQEAADRLGISRVRIYQLIRADKIKAIRIGRDWLINPDDLVGVKVYGKSGRPRKTENTTFSDEDQG